MAREKKISKHVEIKGEVNYIKYPEIPHSTQEQKYSQEVYGTRIENKKNIGTAVAT